MSIGAVHAAGFIHRDVKPDNFLFDNRGHLYLTDLGLCKAIEDDDLDATTVRALERAYGAEKAGAAASAGDARADAARTEGPPAAYIRDRKLAYSTVGTPEYIDYQVLLKKGYGPCRQTT
jgi:serine/threonine protein kinase